MNKKNLLRALEAVLFCALTIAMLGGLSRLLERKDSREQFGPFLDSPEQYDVLFLGDSCFVNCLFPMELWEDYGITGYNLSCYGNKMATNYWTMMNALQYASPKAVVLAVNDVHHNKKVTGSSGDLHTAMDFWPMSRTKVQAIWDLTDDSSAMDDDGQRYMDMRWEYLFTLGKYHDRWSELLPKDYAPRANRQKGANMMVNVAKEKDYDIIDEDRYAEEQGAGYAYMHRIIETCQSRGIDILLVQVPYPASEEDQMHANTVSSIAEEYGVHYINFLQLDSVADYATDCYDDHAHLNPSGGRKVTDFIGRYLKDHYGLADHRGEAEYADWEREQAAYRAYKWDLIRVQEALPNLLLLLHDDGVSVDLAIHAQAELYWDDQILTLLHNVAREHVLEEDLYSAWSNSMFPLGGLDEAVGEDAAYFLALDRASGSLSEWTGEEAERQAEQTFAGWEAGGQICIRVRDAKTGEEIVERQF